MSTTASGTSVDSSSTANQEPRKRRLVHDSDLSFKWIPSREPDEDRIEVLGSQLQDIWDNEVHRVGRKRASLARAMFICFGRHFLRAAFCEMIGKCVCGITTSIILGLLVNDIQTYSFQLDQNKIKQNQTNATTGVEASLNWGWSSVEAHICYKSVMLFLLLTSGLKASQYYLYQSTYTGMKCRLACTYLIYRKALKISLVAFEATTSGQIMNLITNDVNKFDTAFYYMQYIYIAPLHTIVVLSILATFYMGPIPTSVGGLLICVYLTAQVFLGRLFGNFRKDLTLKIDERVRLMGELIDSIAIIKMYAWEEHFEKNISRVRSNELSVLKRVLTLRAINLSLFYGASKLVLMVIFVTYVLMGNLVSSGVVFTALTMTNSMRTYLTLYFPYSVALFSEIQVSLERIRQFLIQDEMNMVQKVRPLPLEALAEPFPSISSTTLRRHQMSVPSTSTERTSKLGSRSRDRRLSCLITPNSIELIEHMDKSALSSSKHPSDAVGLVPSLQVTAKQSTECKICNKFDRNDSIIDKKFAIVFHKVSVAWPKTANGNCNSNSDLPPSESCRRATGPTSQSLPAPPQQQQQQQQTSIFNNLTAHIKHHEFVMIVGRVGAGKSSLLMTLLNELPIQGGSIRISGSISYASQEPWLFAGSLRENITIAWHKRAGRDYKHMPPRLEHRYREVLRICCLDRDINLLPEGDQTLVGERGSTLSGGQKARVNLARALFYDADIYLLDDPLSAVDSSVAKYIFDECFRTFLKRKTVLLVTHQVQFSAPAQKVLLLYDSPEFCYGPATRVLYKLFKQYNIDPKAAVPNVDQPNEECKVVPVPVNEDLSNSGQQWSQAQNALASDERPIGEIETGSLTNMQSLSSDELIQTVNSLEDFIGSNKEQQASVRSDPDSLEQQVQQQNSRLAESARTIKQIVAKQPTAPMRSPTFRLLAETSVASNEAAPDSPGANLETYLYYTRQAAPMLFVFVFVLANVMTQFLFNGTDYFLSEWSNSEEISSINRSLSMRTDNEELNSDAYRKLHWKLQQLLQRSSNVIKLDSNGKQSNKTTIKLNNDNNTSAHSEKDLPRHPYGFFDGVELKYMCLIYLAIIICLLTASFARNMIFFRSCFRASTVIHEKALHAVLHAPMSFFDRNSIGSILARFSTDLDTLDDAIPQNAIDVIEISTNVTGIIIVTAIVSIYNVIPAFLVLFVANYCRRVTSRAITRLKQIEAIKRGRVFSRLMSTLHGLTTIRVFKLETVINRRFERAQNEHTHAWYSYLNGLHRLTVSIDTACISYFFVLISITLLMVFLGYLEASLVGLLVSQVIILPGPLQWGARQITELQSLMTALIRIRDYASLEGEQEVASAPKLCAPVGWPSKGSIRYEKVTLSYVSGADVLSDVSFEILPGQRIGIVGRTGAGKSSVIAALFRMIDYRGHIYIDDVDTKQIKLSELRSSVSIIPQEPVLFTGSIRQNLDPFESQTDERIWSALNSVGLKKLVAELDGGLSALVSEGGHNFSAGQRQLVCLARAILRQNKVLVLDEATANVDPETDEFIQTTIRDRFKGCTLITIAHRLHTIMDSDKVLVLDASKVREFDEPHVLLQNSSSLFAAMVASTGVDAVRLKRIAELNYVRARQQQVDTADKK